MGDRIVIMKDGFVQQIGTPRQVFHDPANLFVAGFIGTPQMNFFDCRLEKDENYYVLLAGQRVELAPEKQRRLAENNIQPQDIVLGVRPEHLHLAEQGFTGFVEVTEMMGSNVHLHVRFDETDAVLVVPECEEDFKKGQKICFGFDQSHVHLFHKETEQNLEHSI